MTTQSQVEMELMRANVKRKQAEELAEAYREKLFKIEEIIDTLEEHYNDTIEDVIYKHSEIDDNETGWLAKIRNLAVVI